MWGEEGGKMVNPFSGTHLNTWRFILNHVYDHLHTYIHMYYIYICFFYTHVWRNIELHIEFDRSIQTNIEGIHMNGRSEDNQIQWEDSMRTCVKGWLMVLSCFIYDEA